MEIDPELLFDFDEHNVMCSERSLELIEVVYDDLVREISNEKPLFKSFVPYNITYAADFIFNDSSMAEKVMTLIKMSEIPGEYKKFDVSRAVLGASYLPFDLGDTIVRCYKKTNAIICFDVECKYQKLKPMMLGIIHSIHFRDGDNYLITKKLLSDETCKFIVSDYFKRNISFNGFYTLEEAVLIIENSSIFDMEFDEITSEYKRHTVIWTLKTVSEYGGIGNAMRSIGVKNFSMVYSIAEEILEKLGVHMVTIPNEWKIKYIPPLLDGYIGSDESS